MSALLPCGCGDDQAGAEDTDTDPAPTVSTDPSTSSGTSTSTGNDEADETSTTSTDPSTSGSTTDEPATTSSGSTETSDTGSVESSVLVSIDHGVSPPALMVIVAATASAQAQCDLGPAASYDSLVFDRDNALLAHNVATDRIERIDACDCGFQAIGPTDLGTVEMSIDANGDLIGLDVGLDAFVRLDPDTGLGNIIGPLGVETDDAALAWSEPAVIAHVLDATGDQLMVLDTTTGLLSGAVALGTDITDPGIEVLGDDPTLYMCSGTTLSTLDTTTGGITPIGTLAFAGACTTLAAPREAIDCLEP